MIMLLLFFHCKDNYAHTYTPYINMNMMCLCFQLKGYFSYAPLHIISHKVYMNMKIWLRNAHKCCEIMMNVFLWWIESDSHAHYKTIIRKMHNHMILVLLWMNILILETLEIYDIWGLSPYVILYEPMLRLIIT